MSNETKNRAQRRQAEREERVHHPSFWDKPMNKIIVGVLAAGFLAVVIYAALPQSSTTNTAKSAVTKPTPPPTPVPPTNAPAVNTALTNTAPADPNAKLEKTDVKVGTGTETAALGDRLTVHYTGTLKDGTKFDSSVDKGKPYDLTLGVNLIEGWNQGIVGMKAGGKRKLVVPPSLGYGMQDKGDIPPNSTLYFDIELIKIEKAKK